MIYAIEVNAWTLDLIEKLNDGVRPSAVNLKKPTIFIWAPTTDNDHNELISKDEFDARFNFVDMPDITVVKHV